MALTGRQSAFIDEYMKDPNATKAAKRAGYSEKTARQIGSQNLSKIYIKEEIERRFSENAMSSNEALHRLGQQARAEYSAYLRSEIVREEGEEEGEGAAWVRHWVDLEALLNDGMGHLVKSIKKTANGTNVEFHDAQAALFKIGEVHGLFKDVRQVSGPDGKEIPIAIVGPGLLDELK